MEKKCCRFCKKARKRIAEKNPKCELAIVGGLRYNNINPLIECNPDGVVLSSAIFKDPKGIATGIKSCREAIDAAA